MELLKILFKVFNGYKTYGTAVAAVLAALALVLGGDYLHGLPALRDAIEAIAVIATGGAALSLRHAISKAETAAK